ncbi:unnamed protein product [Durusdinium trenchii]|uniref:Poly [ADP-ribose] polymerase n=2 Tax=Durusdinium trenchii TaxID=1381693 RepID=A0ABP0ITF0_9DINO
MAGSLWLLAAQESQEDECENVVQLWKKMVEDERHFALMLDVGLCLMTLVALGSISFIVGGWVKPRAPGYWTHRPWSPFRDHYYSEVDVTEELRDIVQQLFDLCTQSENMGQGEDGKWVSHRSFRVTQVHRIENGPLWSSYATTKKSIPKCQASLKEMSAALRKRTEDAIQELDMEDEKLHGAAMIKDFVKSLGLDRKRNERLLFHGSPGQGAVNLNTGEVIFPEKDKNPVYAIKQSGFDDRLSSVRGMYGSGVYFAQKACKADQYAGQYHWPPPPGSPFNYYCSVGEKATIFLSRVVLGCPYKTELSLEQLRRPPCIEGHFDLNLLWNEDLRPTSTPWRLKGVPCCICSHQRFDSVMAGLSIDMREKLYREFVVYDKQCYPEFCVTYERCRAPVPARGRSSRR